MSKNCFTKKQFLRPPFPEGGNINTFFINTPRGTIILLIFGGPSPLKIC